MSFVTEGDVLTVSRQYWTSFEPLNASTHPFSRFHPHKDEPVSSSYSSADCHLFLVESLQKREKRPYNLEHSEIEMSIILDDLSSL